MARRRRGLSEDDLEVWRTAARTIRPLKPAMAPIAPRPSSPQSAPEPAPSLTPPPLPSFRIGERTPPAAPARPPRKSVAMDAKTHRKMTRGKLKPEAKIDLHGMTLAQAHPALIGFVNRACGDGLRLVLVVTGKGRDRDTDGPIPTPRGLLRHHVPGWLNSPPLNALVLQVADAHHRHGGGGAYYVYLRRRG